MCLPKAIRWPDEFFDRRYSAVRQGAQCSDAAKPSLENFEAPKIYYPPYWMLHNKYEEFLKLIE